MEFKFGPAPQQTWHSNAKKQFPHRSSFSCCRIVDVQLPEWIFLIAIYATINSRLFTTSLSRTLGSECNQMSGSATSLTKKQRRHQYIVFSIHCHWWAAIDGLSKIRGLFSWSEHLIPPKKTRIQQWIKSTLYKQIIPHSCVQHIVMSKLPLGFSPRCLPLSFYPRCNRSHRSLNLYY